MSSSHTHPRQQKKLIGHSAAEAAIGQAIASGRLPHTWLITGIEGVGKATLAYRFAKFLLAALAPKNGLDVSPDHSAAKLVTAGSHPDMLVIERPYDEKKGRVKRDIPVEEVRKIAPFLQMTANQSQWRIVIIDGADNLNRNGQNAVLKILEEPPAHSLIMLLAESEAHVLPTIRSRSRILHLEPLAQNELKEVAELIGLGDHPGLELLSRMAQGSAARLARYANMEADILFKSWCDFLLSPDNYLVRLRMAEAWAGKADDELFTTVQDIIFLWLSRLIEFKARNTAILPLSAEEKPLINRLYTSVRLDQLMVLWDNLLLQIRQLEKSNLDRKVVFLNMLDKTAAALAA